MPICANCYSGNEKFMNNVGEAFKPARIIGFLLLAALLGSSLLAPGTADIWRKLSLAYFEAVNSSLTLNESWAFMIAYANSKPFDLIGAIAMAIPSLIYLYFCRSEDLLERLARFTVVWVTIIVVTTFSKHGLPTFDYKSPSLVVDDFVNIRDLVPSIKAKFASGKSFPGDHAVGALTALVMALLLIPRRYSLWVALFSLTYAVPRTITGAHWLSDVLVGGGMAALIALALVTGLPSLRWARSLWVALLKISFIRTLLKITGFGALK